MVRITEDMVRKRAEHNELQLSTLEEVSLHQQDIERLEHLDKWCRELKILYLQSNLIPKIENVNKLKKLEYLNLALNNVERVENLEGCESLKKLDLTVNFVGELTSIECLKDSYNLEEIFLTGNPCTEYEGYRPYVIATLPQLKTLDGKDVEKSERIRAMQDLGIIRPRIIQQQQQYKKKRAKQKAEAEEAKKQKEEKENESDEGDNKENQNKDGFDGRWYTDINESDKKKEEEKKHQKKVDDFWQEKTSYTPESRIEVHNHLKEMKEKDEKKEEKEEKKPRRLFAEDGRPFNINEDKLDFTLTEDNKNNIVLDLAVFKFMDTSLLECDVQPTYARVTLKGKIFQLCLPEEVNADASNAKRSQITGHLVITMPKAKPMIKPTKPTAETKQEAKPAQKENTKNSSSREMLEVDSNARKVVDIGNIVSDSKPTRKPLGASRCLPKEERPNSENFVDDPDVPPLM